MPTTHHRRRCDAAIELRRVGGGYWALINCSKLPEPHAGSLNSSGSEFQTDGLAIENGRVPTAVCVELTARYNELVSICSIDEKNMFYVFL